MGVLELRLEIDRRRQASLQQRDGSAASLFGVSSWHWTIAVFPAV
jgi:hypothetical protein